MARQEDHMPYGYIGSMRTQPGCRDGVIQILLGGADGLRAAGCQVYAVGVSDTDADIIWVTEIWDSAERHEASLRLPETRAAIASAMPMLTGEFSRQELTVVGGLGVSVPG
jgi:quinol monooxygenase YgiN